MASKIRVLSDSTINKIAAGEVVENPASVVKELVENAIDAGATEICVEIKGGGRQLIRVSDNGCGMAADDAVLCLERHATSKIREIEDIYALHTMGFRGEAIPSIAAISKFNLLTCSKKEDEKNQDGTMVIVEGGQLLSCSPATRAPGTTIEVKSLFFNIPVRKKFQKSPTYDTQEILKVLNMLALGYPSIQFELISDQKSLLKTSIPSGIPSSQEKLGHRIESILGREFFSAACPISFHKEPYQVDGYIGFPSYTRHNRTGQYLFINQRAVYSPLISFAIREGYGTTLSPNRHPVFVLHLQMPGFLIDINVHPQKKEVRLRQETFLKDSLIEAIQIALRNQGFSEEKTANNAFASYGPFQSSPMPFVAAEAPLSTAVPYWSHPSFTSHMSPTAPWRPSTSLHSTEPDNRPSTLFDLAPIKVYPRVLATINGFILIDASSLNSAFPYYKGPEGLYLVDQKAAHSRVHYERFLKQLTNDKQTSSVQPLLIPLTVDFSPVETALLKAHLEILNGMGFCIQEFGDCTFIVDAIPDILKKDDLKACLMMILQDLQEFQDTRRIQREKEKHIALAACRASIPSKARLSLDEAQALLIQLFECETPFQCPLGRPTLAHIPSDELGKYFHDSL